jgi:hypothetical protein
MSLQLLAKQMEAKGRKGDSMLVHMTPGEVEGLQKLAEAAGGTLTVNPETGLVEANFLKDLIRSPFFAPLAGASLMMIPGVGPMMAAGLVGGGTALATGDVGKGAMAGLGAFGGAGLAGGLGASAAGTAAGNAANIAAPGAGAVATGAGSQASMLAAQNAGFGAEGLGLMAEAAKVPASTAALNTAKAGISGLGSEAGRAAFMQGVGGVGGLAKKASMAAAPAMMAPGEAPGEIPTDDEMYYTEYNPVQTGKRSSTSSEELQLAGGYLPMEKIKADDYMKRRNRQYLAAKGGLMSLAEGGEVADAAPADAGDMTGASKAAFDYLMGNAASSAPAGGITNLAARATPGVGSDNMYAYDPVTGTFLRNPNVAGAETSGSRIGTSLADFGGGGSDYTDPNPGWTNMSDAEKAAYYAENPTMGAITRAGQTVFGYTGLGRAQELFAPGFSDAQRDITFGGSLSPGSVNDRSIQAGLGAIGYDDSPPDMSGFESPSNQSYSFPGNDSMDFGPSPSDFSGMSNQGEGGADSYGGWKAGGLMGLAKGGMKSGGFVIPADVVSMIGEGNTDAGYSRIKSMIPGATAIKGKDGGQADTVKTSIEGKQPARVAHGEMYIPPETVKRMGGAKKLYAMMDRVRQQATGSKKQIKPVSLKRAMA